MRDPSLGDGEDRPPASTIQRLERRAPRSAGLAGIAFSALFLAAALMVSQRPPDGLDDTGLVAWFESNAKTPTTIVALYLVPFSGIAFLWFIGVVRDRLGSHEDRFLATVFLGSGLLFVGMYWSGAAEFGSLVASNRFDAAPPLNAAALEGARSAAFSFMFVLAARAAAVFTIVTSTLIWRSRALPRPLALAGYGIAVVMLVSLSYLQWVVLLFPLWVFAVSALVLKAELSAGGTVDPPDSGMAPIG
jgi:hypothetical protein